MGGEGRRGEFYLFFFLSFSRLFHAIMTPPAFSEEHSWSMTSMSKQWWCHPVINYGWQTWHEIQIIYQKCELVWRPWSYKLWSWWSIWDQGSNIWTRLATMRQIFTVESLAKGSGICTGSYGCRKIVDFFLTLMNWGGTYRHVRHCNCTWKSTSHIISRSHLHRASTYLRARLPVLPRVRLRLCMGHEFFPGLSARLRSNMPEGLGSPRAESLNSGPWVGGGEIIENHITSR